MDKEEVDIRSKSVTINLDNNEAMRLVSSDKCIISKK